MCSSSLEPFNFFCDLAWLAVGVINLGVYLKVWKLGKFLWSLINTYEFLCYACTWQVIFEKFQLTFGILLYTGLKLVSSRFNWWGFICMYKLKFVWFYHKESLESWSMWLCVVLFVKLGGVNIYVLVLQDTCRRVFVTVVFCLW